jgi:CTP:molybdopterin cytidylyltransferase MocA
MAGEDAFAALANELDRAGIAAGDRIENPQPDQGMFSSVQCAARWNGWQPDLSHWLLTLGDQPHVQNSTLRTLKECASRNPDKICQPSRNGRPRHPVFVPRAIFGELAGTPAETLKQFLLGHADQRICFDSGDAGLDFDLDEPADYERAVSLQRAQSGCS